MSAALPLWLKLLKPASLSLVLEPWLNGAGVTPCDLLKRPQAGSMI